MADKSFHIAMYPWFALGHITPYVHMANKLAERGHKISFFLPPKTQHKVEAFNLHPHLITFIPIVVPHVEGLPLGAETTNDVPFPLHPLIMTTMDLTEPHIEAYLRELKPHFVFYDFTCWLPALTRRLGIKSVVYSRKTLEKGMIGSDLLEPPEGFPSSSIKLRAHEAQALAAITTMDYGRGLSFVERQLMTLRPYGEYMGSQFGKPVIFAGPVVPNPPKIELEKQWEKLLSKFEPKTMIFCVFGSECVLKKDQFQELVLGLELTGLPFLVALKRPMGAKTIESALPEGFQERLKGRGILHRGWVPQQLILRHHSVGYFVTHCGSGSLAEAMVSDCQLVLLPHVGDQIISARLMAGDLKTGVEVEKGDEDGVFTKYDVCKAVKTVMDQDNELGNEVRTNHAKWKEFLLKPGLENSYMDDFVMQLHALVCDDF
ncbi:hypothetical protein ES319_A09G059400v1 [Gossypium barbadense]|uniref:Glycosyltransferase n=1 Tax=Gossypium barbadense TaxID=3634 RepID=A0A5J5UBC5_GOSBA|nr:hypothetical protein ES319_A09G059400v1 [Gossypium barbadense]